MKKNTAYYFDEDDAVPIKRKKKVPPKKDADAEKSECISFTPRKSGADVKTFGRGAATKSANAASTDKTTAFEVGSVSKERAVTESKAGVFEKSEKANKSSVSENVSKIPTPPLTTEKTAAKEFFADSRRSDETKKRGNTAVRERIEVAEIPYNREFGRASSSETKNDASILGITGTRDDFSNSERTPSNTRRADTADFRKAPAKETKESLNNTDSFDRVEEKDEGKKRITFGFSFIIYIAVLLVLAISAIFYVHGLLIDYEAAQPENIVQSKIDDLKKACEKGEPGSAVSLSRVMEEFAPTEDDLAKFMDDFLSSDITYKKVSDSSDPNVIAFDILADKYKMAHLIMRSEGKEAKLVIFTMDKWKIEKFEVTGFTMDITLPASLTVKNKEEVIEGIPAEDGKTATYSVSSLTMPEITFTDVMGNTKSYSDDGEYKFTEYLISIPSNYILKGKDIIPLSVATLEDIPDYRYVGSYCDEMPKTADYSICIMSDEATLCVLDNLGNEVDISSLGNSFTIEGQKGFDTLPENIVNAPDPLEMAKQWSLFMTDDLKGKTHGFYNMEKYLIADSYLHNVAWEWATGVDITFTSPHTLAKNPFTTAEASNFVSYSDTCFSCDVLLEKPMYITRANTVIDKIYSTFYFVYCDDTDDGRDNPHWAIADIQKIAE